MTSPGPSHHVALVTGANHGIGAALAERIAARGIPVLVAFLALEEPDDPDNGPVTELTRNHALDGSAVVARIRAGGGRALAVSADLRDAEAIPRLFDVAEEAFGPVDILINNATGSLRDTFGVGGHDWMGRRMARVSAATFDRQFGVDARGGALMISEFAERHIARGATWGRIISMTSGGENGFPEEVSYGAAKAALVNYTMAARLELSAFGVTANALHPPVTDTGWVTDEVRAAVARDKAFFSVAEPDEIGDVVEFLVSDAARRVTGSVIRMG